LRGMVEEGAGLAAWIFLARGATLATGLLAACLTFDLDVVWACATGAAGAVNVTARSAATTAPKLRRPKRPYTDRSIPPQPLPGLKPNHRPES